MATEAEVKAQERRELLNDIRRRRAAAAQAEGSLGAAERGDYGEVGQGEKGPFDDEINQDPNNSLENLMSLQGGDVSQLDLTKAQRGVLPKSPIDAAVKKGLGFFFRKSPIGLALTYGPEIVKMGKNLMMPADKAVTNTGEILNMKPEGLEGLFVKGAKGQKTAEDILKDKNVSKILEDARMGKITEVQAALGIQKIFPGSGMIKTDSKVAGGFGTTAKFRDDVFSPYVFNNKADDIFETKIKTFTGADMQRITKGNILKAKKIADEDVSDLDYSIKFRNALSEFYKPKSKEKTFSPKNNAFYDTHELQQIENAKTIFKFLDIEPSILDMATKTGEKSGFNLFKKIKVADNKPITGEARNYFRANVIFDDTGKTFRQIQTGLLKKNKFVSSKLQQVKKLHTDESVKAYDLDHIQAPRFGGTNAENNLQLLTRGEHLLLKDLPQLKTNTFTQVRNKTNFENEFFDKSVKIIDLIKKGDTEKAVKLGSELDTLVNSFKNTYKSINFKVGEPHFAYKTSEKAGKFVKYSEKLNLTKDQKKIVDKLLNKEEYSNLKNAGKTIEQQTDEILNSYQQISLLTADGKIPTKPMKIPGDITSMDVPRPSTEINLTKDFLRFKTGGMVGISHLTRPL